ncbi:glutathione S-transferase [Sphingobium sp. SCG-1]|uniref:glutathione S-transferase family protein n=1 Tax=Sphingobium sp. SCG-1 TaxID=2072936 RepID=UPI000CD6802B|nr:glutathione S-transferase family protein [Sphingobium sp. SCG-1]AUW59227.1 glutathione S-transferase [Sphingobium sp. SCG-1]
MILYGMRPSPYVRKALFFAAEKGIEVEVKGAGFGRGGDAFAAASPFGKMPALVDGDFGISDSSAIIHYWEALRPEPNMIPTDPKARARTIWFEEFADTILFETGRKMFFNRIVAPKFMKIEGDMAAADAAERDELPQSLAYLENVIPDSGFLVEDRMTLADVAVASPLINLAYCSTAMEAYPRICQWIGDIKKRPTIAAVLEDERPMIEGMAERPEAVI